LASSVWRIAMWNTGHVGAVFERAVKEIEDAYSYPGHGLGWRFLCVPAGNLAASTPIALITANPGGNAIPEDHPMASCESGSPYLIERWGASAAGRHKLQLQVQHLFADVAVACGGNARDGLDLLQSSLVAYFIPFRSPRLSELHRRQESRAFARRLWTNLFEYISPKLIITIDKDTWTDVRSIINEKTGSCLYGTEEVMTGWGRTTATIDRYALGIGTVTLLRLPHLSTFQLFTSRKCRERTRDIIVRACEGLRIPIQPLSEPREIS
jgi:hypothetical protein